MSLLITGGASGIGAETARRAAERGYQVAINYRSREQQAMKVVSDIVARGGKAVALPADLSLWEPYFALYAKDAQREPPDFAESVAYYRANREALERGAEASWPARKLPGEVSALVALPGDLLALEASILSGSEFYAKG